jgi:hypothetical protein
MDTIIKQVCLDVTSNVTLNQHGIIGIVHVYFLAYPVYNVIRLYSCMFKSCSKDIPQTSPIVAFNTHCWPRREVVKLPDADYDPLQNFVTQKLKCGGTLGTLYLTIDCILILKHWK